ncbi:MAG: hypothetical protein V2A67_11530 [Bacteroidota bacterium]
MKLKYLVILPVLLGLGVNSVISQNPSWPAPPQFDGYKGKPGKIVKYNVFNYLDIRKENGENLHQVLGHYWEISYAYDSVFRQKKKFKEFVVNQILEKGGQLFFQDTLQIHFVVPEEQGNVWGRLVLSSDKVYRLRLIKETKFDNPLKFGVKPDVRYDRFVDSVDLPPRIAYLRSSVIARIQFSKFNHLELTWNVKDTLYRQKVMGPYWDIKLEVRDQDGEVDRSVSTVEVLESYYRACMKAGGTILKSRPRELLFILPIEQSTLWCRVTATLDGVYLIRIVIMDDKDKTLPEKMVTIPPTYQDSLKELNP